jgi:uncharacterized protein YjbI with pentapeptide repeats
MSASDQPVPFGSISELREAGDALLHAYHDEATAETERAEKVVQFVRRASATGALLDTPRDRREAQSLIDYWISNSYRTNQGDVPGREALSRVENQLRRFNEDLVKEAVKSGQAYIESIDGERVALTSNFPRWPWEWPAFRAKRIDIARRLLLRLVRLPETDGTAVSRPSRVDRLQSLDDTRAVDQCLRDLQSREIVMMIGVGPDAIVSLKYESLITDWPWLADLIEERMSYRRAAVRWAQTGRRSISFLDWFRQKKFRKNGDLNELEQVYATETWNKTVRTAGPTAIYLLAYFICVAVFFFLFAQPLYQLLFVTQDDITLKYSAIVGPTQSRSVASDIRWLADYDQDQELKFAGATLADLDLSKLLAPAANLTLATLNHVNLEGARLQAASFQKARLNSVDFTDAKLNKVGFDGATIKNTMFVKAKLDRAVFDGATFCDGVDFSNADVRNASFKSMTFAGKEPPTFRGFAWWLVDGWTFDQRAMLGKKQMENDPFQRDLAGRVRLDLVPTLREDLENADRNLAQYKDNKNQAIWLGDRSWTLAIYGADSPDTQTGETPANSLDGATAALAAIALVKGETDPENIHIDAAAKDSLGYVLLQRGSRATGAARGSHLQSAVQALEQAVGLSNEGGIYFRYAAALDAVGRGDDATKSLRIALVDRSYTPTHELYLLDKLFSPSFRKQIQLLLSPPPAAGGKSSAIIAGSQKDPCQ